MQSVIAQRLARRGLTLPDPPKPGGAYDSVRVMGNVAYVAAQFPFVDGQPAFRGRIGRELTTEQGHRAAEIAALNVLAALGRYVGFERVAGMNRFDAYLQTAAPWDEFPRVVDGASELFLLALGDAGRHARALFGVERLPLDLPVELTASFTLHP